MAKTFKWTIEIEVSADTVADGLDLDNNAVMDVIARGLPYCSVTALPRGVAPVNRLGNVAVRVLKAPKADAIAKAQGYENDNARMWERNKAKAPKSTAIKEAASAQGIAVTELSFADTLAKESLP